MNRRASWRMLVVIASGLTASALSVAPASAFYETVNQGNTGFPSFPEYPGAFCIYNNNPGQSDDDLDRVKAVQFWTHGPYQQSSKVVVRFQFQRNTPPHSDNVFTTYYHTPSIVKYADTTNVAFFGPRTYHVPNNTPDRWRVRILINYYNRAGTLIVGRIRGITEVYEHQLAGQSSYQIGSDGSGPNGYCKREWWPPVP